MAISATVLGNVSQLAALPLSCLFGTASTSATVAIWQNTSSAIIQCSGPAGYLGSSFQVLVQSGRDKLSMSAPLLPLNATWSLEQASSSVQAAACLAGSDQEVRMIA